MGSRTYWLDIFVVGLLGTVVIRHFDLNAIETFLVGASFTYLWVRAAWDWRL